MDDVQLQQIKALITKQTGLRILDDKGEGFRRLIQHRLDVFKLASVTDYYQLLLRFNRIELAIEHQQLSLALTTGETYFFRDQGQMDLLSQHILPELLARNRNERRLRIWSAGCASGEEAYSLAMLLDELDEDLSGWEILILGTDINSEALLKARQGHYRDWSFRQVTEQRRDHYFQHIQATWVLNARIRERVHFRQFDLATECFPADDLNQMDLIVCRNVFIYLEPDRVTQIADKMTAALVEGGYLMTGHGELYAHHLGDLRTRIFPHSIVYQKAPHPQAPSIALPQKPAPASSKARMIPPVAKTERVNACAVVAVTMQAAWAYANQGQPEQARVSCTKLIAQNPLDHQPYYLLALLAQEQEDLDETKALLKKTLYLAPDFVSAYLELGDIYAKENSPTWAFKMWTCAFKLLQQLPEDTPVEMFGNSTVGEVLKFVENRLHQHSM